MFANKWVRWLIPLVIVAVLAAVLHAKVDFIKEGLGEVRSADPVGVAVTLLLSCLSLFAMGEVMRLLLAAGGTRTNLRHTTELVFAANAWSTSFPGGQALATVLSFNTMRSWGASVVLCSWQIVVSGTLSTMWLVCLGLAATFTLGASIPIWSLVPTLAIMCLLSALVYWATSHPRALARWARRIIPKINRLLRREPAAGLDCALEHIHQLDAVELSKGKFATAATWSLANWALDIAALIAAVGAVTGALPALHAETNHTTIAGVVLAYVSSKIAGTVQATPGGLGPVEAALTATLVAVGMTAVGAVGTVLVYRMMSLVGVTVIGWIVHAMVFARRGVNAKTLAAEEPSR
nr:YbhN family protein [Corynebacterium mendelii]